jgi:methylmalonyl-CoA mutase C-terminal domain/subunit
MTADRRIRVLLAKPGLDGHDVGAKVIARSLMEAGFEVTYTGLRKSPEQIAGQASELGVDVIGLSVLSGSHVPLCERFRALRKEHGLQETLWLVGGVIPDEDHDRLKQLGVDAVFTAQTPLEEVAAFIRERVS